MQPSDFAEEQRSRLIHTREGHWAFVPAALPPALVWTPRLVRAVTEAQGALGLLAGVGRQLQNPHLLIKPLQRREAVLSSRIENTFATVRQLFLFEAEPSAAPQGSDVREVDNYVRALEHGLARLNELPLCLRLLQELHADLMAGVRGDALAPGEFRRVQSFIGRSARAEDASYVPPPPAEMMAALHELEQYLHHDDELPPLIRISLAHYQFEAIHPFLDGNGRTGRLLITIQLCAEKLLPQPLLYLSAFFEAHRDDYYQRLLGVSRAARWTEWIEFFLEGVKVQCEDAVRRSDALLTMRARYHEQFASARSSALVVKLIDELFATPMMKVSQVAKLLKVTVVSAQRIVDKLCQAGVLSEVTGRKKHRVFAAREILEAVAGPEPESPEAAT